MNMPKTIFDDYNSGEPNSFRRLVFLHEHYVEDGKVYSYHWDRGLWLCFLYDVLGNQILTKEQIEKFAKNVSNSEYK